MPILLASPGVFAGYKALAACLSLKRNAESYTRGDADKMSALPAQPTGRPEKLPGHRFVDRAAQTAKLSRYKLYWC